MPLHLETCNTHETVLRPLICAQPVTPGRTFNLFLYKGISSESFSSTPFSIGALVGWQWFPGDQFALGLGIGIDQYFGSIKDEDTFHNYNGLAPALRFDIGFAW